MIIPSSAYGQRVYAGTQQNADNGLASVTNPNYAIDSNTTNYTTLNVLLGALGLTGVASQNLQFTGALKPAPTAPLMIRFATGGSLVGLFDGIEVQRTSGGINNTVGTPYSSGNLLDLLGLVGGEEPNDVIVPVPGGNESADGVQIRISSALLGLGMTIRSFYAFFITPPSVDTASIEVCEGEDALIGISNFQSGYTYRLFDSLTGGNQIASGNTNVLNVNANNLSSTTYYLEAVEGGTEFTSSRTPIDITIIPKPGHPDLDLNVNSN